MQSLCYTYFMVCILFSAELFCTLSHNWYAALKSIVMINNQIPTEFPPSWGCDISYSDLTSHFTAVPLDPIHIPTEIHAHVHTQSFHPMFSYFSPIHCGQLWDLKLTSLNCSFPHSHFLKKQCLLSLVLQNQWWIRRPFWHRGMCSM